MVGYLAGHALPNALVGGDVEIKLLAFFVGVAITGAMVRFMRVCGDANFQLVGNTDSEPYRLFDDETGDERSHISTHFGRTPLAEVVRDPYGGAGSVDGNDSSHESGVFGSVSGGGRSSRDMSPRRRVLLQHSMGDDMAEDVAAGGDDRDVLRMRRWMATVIYCVYTVYGTTDGVFLVYNHHAQPGGVLVACFYVSKIMSAVVLSGFMAYAYVHLYAPRQRGCCGRRWVYPALGVLFALNATVSCLPIFLGTTTAAIAAWVAPNVAFGAFGAAVAGIMVPPALRFAFREAPEASARSETLWWAIFVATGGAAWATGLFL